MWPNGKALSTLTRSPGLKLAGTTPLQLEHLLRQLGAGDEPALQRGLHQRHDPALVIRHAVVRLRRQLLDVPAALVDGDAVLAHQPAHRVDAPLPLGVVVLGRLDLAGRQPAHVVVAPLDHATHSDTGALASCSGWQTMSTSVGSPECSASFKVFESSRGSVARQDLMP